MQTDSELAQLTKLNKDRNDLWAGVYLRGLLSAFIAATIVALAINFAPREWHYIAIPAISSAVIVFWVFVAVRGTAVDLLFEIGLVYPSLHSDPEVRREAEEIKAIARSTVVQTEPWRYSHPNDRQ